MEFYLYFHFMLIFSSWFGLFVLRNVPLFSFFQIGFIRKLESLFLLLGGRYGEKYDTPNDCRFESRISWMNIPKLMPRKPAM